MTELLAKPCTAFEGDRLLLSGPLVEVVLAVKNASASATGAAILVFDEASGRVMDFDLRGTKADIIERLAQPDGPPEKPRRPAVPVPAAGSEGAAEDVVTESPAAAPRGRGRPRLGVIGREVTLLPRQWEWLAAQPGGASVALRKLVDQAKRNGSAKEQMRLAQEAAYRFMATMAGDRPGFEEATRALFANDRARFEEQAAGWPPDVRAYASRLAFGMPVESAPRDSA